MRSFHIYYRVEESCRMKNVREREKKERKGEEKLKKMKAQRNIFII